MALRETIIPVLATILLLFAGCSTGVIVHDQTRAAELVVDFFSSLKSDPGIKLAYEWSDDRYKEEVSFLEFSDIVASIRDRNLGADIRLVGYEVFGAKEAMVVYANSVAGEQEIYFKLSLFGSKSRDYYLLGFSTNDSGFKKHGVYRKYRRSIVVQGV